MHTIGSKLEAIKVSSLLVSLRPRDSVSTRNPGYRQYAIFPRVHFVRKPIILGTCRERRFRFGRFLKPDNPRSMMRNTGPLSRRKLSIMILFLAFSMVLSAQTTILCYDVNPQSQERGEYFILDGHRFFEMPKEIKGFRLSENQEYVAVFHDQIISVVRVSDNKRHDTRITGSELILDYEVTDNGALVLSAVDLLSFLPYLTFHVFSAEQQATTYDLSNPMPEIVYGNHLETFAMAMDEPKHAIKFFNKSMIEIGELDITLPYAIAGVSNAGFLIVSGRSCLLVNESGENRKELFSIESDESFISVFYDSATSAFLYTTESQEGFNFYSINIGTGERQLIGSTTDSVPFIYAGIRDLNDVKQILDSFSSQE